MFSRVVTRRFTPFAAMLLLAATTVVVAGNPAAAAGTATLTGPATITEGTNGQFVVTRDDTTGPESIFYTVTPGGGAVAGDVAVTDDGGPAAGSLDFIDGQAVRTITVAAVDDVDGETGETAAVAITGSQSGTTAVAGGPIVAALADDGDAGSLAFTAAAQATNEGAVVTVEMVRTGGSEGSVSATVTNTDGSATAGSDYTAVNAFRQWGVGETVNKQLTVDILSDAVAEDAETIELTFTTVGGAATGGVATHIITITDDDALSAGPDSSSTVHNVVLNVGAPGVLGNDTQNTGLAVSPTGSRGTAQGGTAFVRADGSYDYTPPNNFVGNDSFTYNITDSGSSAVSPQGTVTILVTNSSPTGPGGSFFEGSPAIRNTTASLPVASNHSDADGDTLAATASSATSSQGGSVSCAGASCSYTPPAGFAGIDTFSYTVSDGFGGSVAGTATVFVGMSRGCDQTGSNLTGTAGDEILCGTSGADTINGGGGNDVIIGNGGNDNLSGGAGNDLVHGGGGNDTLNVDGGVDEVVGGSGADAVVVAGTSGDDSVTLGATGGVGSTWSQISSVSYDAGAGNDTVIISPSATVSFEAVGGAGLDRLTYQSAGVNNVNDNGAVITGDNVQNTVYSNFEVVESNSLLILGTPGADDETVSVSPVVGLRYDLQEASDKVRVNLGNLAGPVSIEDSGTTGSDTLLISGKATGETINVAGNKATANGETVLWSGIERLEIDGASGDDTFIINGNGLQVASVQAAAVSSMLIVGGAGSDLLVLTSTTACTIDTVSNPGTVTIGGLTISLHESLEGLDATCAGTRRVVAVADGYWVGETGGQMFPFGQVNDLGDVGGTPNSPIGAMASHPGKIGHWAVEEDGTVHAFGRSAFFGDVDHLGLNGEIVSMASTRTGDGYYLLGSDGGVFTHGDAEFFGSTGNIVLAQPVVAMAANPVGRGYWFAATDGGVFTYGTDTDFHGSVPQVLPGVTLNQPIVGMAPTATGKGYWLVAADGGVFTFGDAEFLGSVPQVVTGPLVAPVIGIIATPSGRGYWMVAADGGVFTFGDAPFFGSLGGQGFSTIVDLAG